MTDQELAILMRIENKLDKLAERLDDIVETLKPRGIEDIDKELQLMDEVHQEQMEEIRKAINNE